MFPTAILGPIIGALTGLVPHVKEVLEAVIGNKKESNAATAAENTAIYEAYGKEWSYAAVNRNKWDSLWDGLNRMPRPLLGLGTFLVFAIAFIDPDHAGRSFAALAKLPSEAWALLVLVVTFYFGSRYLEKGSALKGAMGIVERQAATAPVSGNPVVEQWRAEAMQGD